jgi:hypothetical protein
VIEATSTGGRQSDFFAAEKLAAGNLGLLQQYLPLPDSCSAAKKRRMQTGKIETAFAELRFAIQIYPG